MHPKNRRHAATSGTATVTERLLFDLSIMAAISAPVAAIAVFRRYAVSGNHLRARCVWRCESLFSTPRRKCTPIAAADPEGDSDAHPGFGDFGDWNGLRFSAGAGPDLRFGLSGLPACLRPGQLL